MLKIIANAEYRPGASNSTPKAYQKKAQKLFAELGENVEIVKIKCKYNGMKYHLFAFGEDVSKPLYRQQGRIEVSEKQRALHGPDYMDGADHFYAVWSDWQDGTGYTEYQAQAQAAIKKHRQEKQAKEARPAVGRRVAFWANQGWREGEVLAAIEDRVLIAYRMPAGAVYMVIVTHDSKVNPNDTYTYTYVRGYRYGSYKSISANALKKNAKWLAEVQKVEGFEGGNVDQGLEYLGEDLE